MTITKISAQIHVVGAAEGRCREATARQGAAVRHSAAAGASGRFLLPAPLPVPVPPSRHAPGRSLVSYKIPFQISAASPYTALFPPASNLPSFVNISWTAYMYSCTKIVLTIETIISLHCYATSCTRSFCFSSLVSSLVLMARRKQLPCKQPQEQESSVLITSTDNASRNSIKSWKANFDQSNK